MLLTRYGYHLFFMYAGYEICYLLGMDATWCGFYSGGFGVTVTLREGETATFYV